MQNCCYCFNLKTGTIASALFILITRTFLLILFSVILGYYHTKPDSYWGKVDAAEEEYLKVSLLRFLINILIIKPGVIKSLGPAAAECFLLAIFSTILYFGVRQNNKQLFWPWMVLLALEITTEVIAAAVCIVTMEIYIALVPVILLVYVLVLNCYLLHCVLTYYKILAAIEHSSTEQVMQPSQQHISARRPCILVHPPA